MPCGSFKIFSLFLLCYKKAVPGTSPLIDTSHAAVSPPKKTKCWVVICQLFLIARSSINILANHTISFGKTSDVNLDPHSFSLLDPDPDPDTGWKSLRKEEKNSRKLVGIARWFYFKKLGKFGPALRFSTFEKNFCLYFSTPENASKGNKKM